MGQSCSKADETYSHKATPNAPDASHDTHEPVNGGVSASEAAEAEEQRIREEAAAAQEELFRVQRAEHETEEGEERAVIEEEAGDVVELDAVQHSLQERLAEEWVEAERQRREEERVRREEEAAALRKQILEDLRKEQADAERKAKEEEVGFTFEEMDYDFEEEAAPTEVKTILVVGETGSGKSTLVNAMANWAAGVGYNDTVRYRLVKEPPQNQAFSQTQEVKTYMVVCEKYSFVLRLIDTPGFGDTSGVERDEQITKDIYRTLQSEDEIHGICFVAAASLPRLTVTQQYIISKVLTMFGSDAAANIFLLVTFADGKKAQVLNAIQESGFPYEEERCFHFNNSALFAKGEDRNEHSKHFWLMGGQSLDRFFELVAEMEPFNLTRTKDVIETQQKLQNYVVSITPQVTIGLSKMDNLKQVLKDIKLDRSKIDENANYQYKETIPKVERKNKKPGTWNTQCLKCVYDCHHDCDREDKEYCYVFDDNNGGRCTVCPGNCHHSDHANLDYYFEWGVEVVSREYDTKKMQLSSAKEGLTRSEVLKEKVLKEMQDVYETVHRLMTSIHEAHAKLDEIALRPTNLQFGDYVKLLIEQEKLHKRPGFDGRIEQLHMMLNEANILTGVVNNDYDPIDDWKQRVDAELKELDVTWERPEEGGPANDNVPTYFSC